jgi:hypothetical protein
MERTTINTKSNTKKYKPVMKENPIGNFVDSKKPKNGYKESE